MPPLIGISSWLGTAMTDGYEVNHVFTHASYVRSVTRAGGLPVTLPQLEPGDVDAILDRVDGVVLVGGPDVDPSHYGQDRAPATEPASPGRDDFDLALAMRCVERNQPLLAICRGVQVLNVALGGSLCQHIDGHKVFERWNDSVHDVEFEPASRVMSVIGATRLSVNSLHHQAVADTGEGVRVVAWADDGTAEAIEIEGAPDILGVQWHAELLRHRPEQLALFADLVNRAGRA